MPKIIPELRENLIEAARKRILSREHDVTIRQVASDVGAAVGTVYNYFPSKELLLAAVMLEDWRETEHGLLEAAEAADSIPEGLLALERELRRFVERYAPAWQRYAGRADMTARITEHHRELIRQLGEAVTALLTRCGRRPTALERDVVSEMLLTASQRERGTMEKLMPVIEKIIH